MIRFNSDYLEGAHPRILEQLSSTNMAQTPGYGEDMFCDRARETIRRLCDAPNADVHFLVGGTQTNATVLAAMLLPYQGVISADTGHIAVHETGAIEAGGHKVIALKNTDGKLDAGQVSECCRLHFSDESHEHMVMPAVVYISNPTEERLLTDPAYQRKLAGAILRGVDTYFLRQPPPGTLYAARASAQAESGAGGSP